MGAFLTARYFGMRNFGAVHGLTYGAFVAGCSFGPPLVGALYSIQGNYRLSIMVLAGVFVTAAGTLLFCTKYPEWEATSMTPVISNPMQRRKVWIK
jgi:MFS family permease